VSKAKEEGVESMSATRTEAMGRAELRSMMGLQLENRMPKRVATFQMRRVMLGKSSQTLMPRCWPRVRIQTCLISCTRSKQNLRLTGAGLPRL